MLQTNMATHTYAMDLLQLKEEINQLKTLIAMAVQQITQAIALLQDNPSPPMSNAMEIKAENKSLDNLPESNDSNHAPPDLLATIKELQTEIVQLTKEMQAFTQQKLLPQLNSKHNQSSATWL